MNNMKSLILIVTFILSSSSNIIVAGEVEIPRSTAGDKGKYYLLDATKHGNIIHTMHKRVGVDSTGYTASEVNCSTNQIRVLGYSEESPSAINEEQGEWIGLVEGSSKSDLAKFVCR